MSTQYIPDSLYAKILANVPISCVDFCLAYKGRILLVKRIDAPAKGLWWVPGGRVLKGEMMYEAVCRKCVDEIGVECFTGPIVHTAETIFPDGPLGQSTHSINSCFLVYPKNSQEVTLDSHHEDYVWVNKIDDNLHPYVKECLKGAGLR
jgi:colanic acid biosynthesis protein WcaH